MALNMAIRGASVLGAAIALVNQFQNSTPSEVHEKTRYLQITLVNMSSNQRIEVEDEWFDIGRFWSPQPLGSIPPGSSTTFFVCNGDFTMFTGVSGGIGLRVYDNDFGTPFTTENNDWWICTFSSPYIGSNKCLTQWKDFGIKPLWDKMEKAHQVTDTHCGCYQKDANHMVFIWKNKDSNW